MPQPPSRVNRVGPWEQLDGNLGIMGLFWQFQSEARGGGGAERARESVRPCPVSTGNFAGASAGGRRALLARLELSVAMQPRGGGGEGGLGSRKPPQLGHLLGLPHVDPAAHRVWCFPPFQPPPAKKNDVQLTGIPKNRPTRAGRFLRHPEAGMY